MIANVNGLALYYDTLGAARADAPPLVALHGGLGSAEMFGDNLARLAAHRQVIAVDLQAHGRTADIDRPLSYEAMADDVAALIEQLGLPAADVLGYSMGGCVAAQVAIRHRARVRKLVCAASAFSRAGYHADVRAGFDALGAHLAEMMKPSPVYQRYMQLSPKPDFAGLLGKLAALVQREFDWRDAIGALPPTLLVIADADAIAPAHAVEVFAALGGGLRDAGWNGVPGRPASQLAILPGHTHYDLGASPALVAAIEPFLESK